MADARLEMRLGEAIQGGIDALDAEDQETATVRFGDAVRLATELGNLEAIELLSQLCEIMDPLAGRVRLRPEVTGVSSTGIPGVNEWFQWPDSGSQGGALVRRSPKPGGSPGSARVEIPREDPDSSAAS